MMKTCIAYIFFGLVLTIFAPFFTLGYTVGQFVGAVYYGYKSGRTAMLNNVRYVKDWSEKKKKDKS